MSTAWPSLVFPKLSFFTVACPLALTIWNRISSTHETNSELILINFIGYSASCWHCLSNSLASISKPQTTLRRKMIPKLSAPCARFLRDIVRRLVRLNHQRHDDRESPPCRHCRRR